MAGDALSCRLCTLQVSMMKLGFVLCFRLSVPSSLVCLLPSASIVIGLASSNWRCSRVSGLHPLSRSHSCSHSHVVTVLSVQLSCPTRIACAPRFASHSSTGHGFGAFDGRGCRWSSWILGGVCSFCCLGVGQAVLCSVLLQSN
jgi:hypothetical protein